MPSSGRLKRLFVTVIAASTATAFAAEPTTRRAGSSIRVAATRPATSRAVATRPARAPEPLRDAIAMLSREANEAARGGKPFAHPDGGALAGREDLPELRLIEALDDRQNPEPRLDAYIKLNLIGAFDRFDPANAAAAIRVYVLGAPTLAIYPTADAHERQDWERKIGQVSSAESVAKVNDDYEAAIAKVDERNEMMLRYRDALREKLWAEDDVTWAKIYAAQLEDLAQRSALGIDTDKLLTPLAKKIDQWSNKASRPALRQMIATLNEYASRKEPPIVFTKMTWSEKTRKARWGQRDAALDATKLKKLLDVLKERETLAK